VVPATTAPTPDEADPAIRHAREQVETRRAELREAEARVRAAEERVRVMERSIQSGEKMLQIERDSVTQAEKSAARLSNTLRTQPPADPAERDALTRRLAETEGRLAETRTRVQRITDRLGTLNETLAGLKDELDVATKEAGERKQRVAEAEAELDSLLSPTAPRNLFRWVATKGPRILLIVLGMGLVHLGVRQFSRHIVRFITRNGQRGSPEDRENRANTLVGVFRYAAGVAVFGGGLLMLLDELGVPVVPLMGGAAVVGLAVAFGAQNLIRDYFTGFMMLMEDQYSVNDVVKIGAISGLVELITLRMTVLRDLEGIRHFIPHGTITSVSNLTHGWSRALIDVPIPYAENVDRVITVLMQLGKELRIDPKLGRHILEDPEMLGVEALGDSGVQIRFLLKTRPLQQWPVKREMLRRIKARFDELGIEIAAPRRTVLHRFPEGTAGAAVPHHEGDRHAA
jgi:small conductance mechanosensitive channel